LSLQASQLDVGTIVWEIVRDPNGFRKRRPVIVPTRTEEISSDAPIVVMAITTTFPNPPPANHVALPWNPHPRRVSTGLARRSAAVIGWLDTLYLDEIESVIGKVPPKIVREILAQLADEED
jgi:hypothetical protein